jgi:hypothetical protein
MRLSVVGLAAIALSGWVAEAAAADLPYRYGERKHRSVVVREAEEVRIVPVSGRIDVVTTPWLRYDPDPQMVCRLGWERHRRAGPRPVEICRRW